MFNSRFQAGKLLAEQLKEEGIGKNPLVMAFSYGGTIVASSIASLLNCPCQLIENGEIKIDQPDKKTIIVADDGESKVEELEKIADSLRKMSAGHITVCLAVFPIFETKQLKEKADRVIVLAQPEIFFDIKDHYKDFPKITKKKAKKALKLL